MTGCFEEDHLHGDLRGVERMYVPVEDVEDDEGEGKQGVVEGKKVVRLTSGQKKIRAEQERREARKKVHAEVDKWVRFYRGPEKYFEVGRVVGVTIGTGTGTGTGEEWEVPGLCD